MRPMAISSMKLSSRECTCSNGFVLDSMNAATTVAVAVIAAAVLVVAEVVESGVLTVGRCIANTNTYLTQTKEITRTIRTRAGRQERCNDGSSSSSSRSLDVGSD